MPVSAHSSRPSLVEAILGEAIQGSWWAHPRSRDIYAVLEQLGDSGDLLTCRLINGKITLVHRRLWSALVRLAHRFTAQQLAQVRQEHTPSGRHENRMTPFPAWAPVEVIAAARVLSEQDAERGLETALPGSTQGRPGRHRR